MRPPERRVPSQETSLRPQTSTTCVALEDHAVSSSDRISNVQIQYIRHESDSPIVIILYVDDLVIRGKELTEINKVKSLLSSRFEMKELHELHYFLGIEVIRTPVGILISQQHYVLNLLHKFGLTECKCVSTPLDRNLKVDANSGTAVCDPTKYRQLIDNLIYLTITRLDLSYSVGLLSQFMQNPHNLHLDCTKRILR